MFIKFGKKLLVSTPNILAKIVALEFSLFDFIVE